MPEILKLYHAAGPDNAGFAQHNFTLVPTQIALGAGASGTSTYALFSATRQDPLPINGLIGSGAGLPLPLLASVTGSGSSQSVNVPTTDPMASGDYWVLDPGSAVQEVVQVTPTDATHFDAIVQNSHASGVLMLKVLNVVTKYYKAQINSVPVTGLSNVNIIRYTPLPAGVYDHYMIAGAWNSFVYYADDVIPWINGNAFTPSISAIPLVTPFYDSALVSASLNPTNAISLRAASFTASGQLLPSVRVQYLLTTIPDADINSILFAYWWDND